MYIGTNAIWINEDLHKLGGIECRQLPPLKYFVKNQETDMLTQSRVAAPGFEAYL